MAVIEEEKSESRAFDAESASEMVAELRGCFAAGKTRSFEWRESQLKSLVKLATDHERDIVEALRSDLAKPELESIIYEVLGFANNSSLFIFFFSYVNVLK